MNTLKSIVLVLVLSAATFAGETSTPPCAVPGETSTPPCTVAQPTDDSIATGGTTSTPTPDTIDIESIGEIVFGMLTLY
jgi:hypothetical protein